MIEAHTRGVGSRTDDEISHQVDGFKKLSLSRSVSTVDYGSTQDRAMNGIRFKKGVLMLPVSGSLKGKGSLVSE